jgi:N utilization substance protein B
VTEVPTIEEPRELAIQALYQADQMKLAPAEAVAGLSGKAARLARGVLDELHSLDTAIEQAAERWSIDRMPVVDRAVLRLALYELRNEPATPTAVILSEAVRIVKEYSTERSGRFVNGVLATLARNERGHEG